MITDIQENNYISDNLKRGFKRSNNDNSNQDRETKYSMSETFYNNKQIVNILKSMLFKNLESIIMIICEDILKNDLDLSTFWNTIIDEMNNETIDIFHKIPIDVYFDIKYKNIIINNLTENNTINQLYPELSIKIKIETRKIFEDYITTNLIDVNILPKLFFTSIRSAVYQIYNYFEGCNFIDIIRDDKHKHNLIISKNDYANAIIRKIRDDILN